MKQTAKNKPEIVEYRVGLKGLADAASYDAVRYTGPAKEYKQAIMANAYTRLVGPLRGKRLLDVGCGTGRGVVELTHEADLAVGSDVSLDMLSLAEGKASSRTNCAFSAAYAQQLPFPDGVFDVAISLNFLHLFTLQTQGEMIAEMKRVVKPGGILVLEFDNALHGLVVGLYKRWSGREQGSLPHEIRRVIGNRCRVAEVYGAVFPIVWRVFWRFPRIFMSLEKIAYLPPFNRLTHRVYYKLVKTGSEERKPENPPREQEARV
jgi:ubiquinone/menaquinone biosynthesis C-methylase UbiE